MAGRKEGKGICYASQNFTFDGIFIFLAPLIFKVTSGAAAAMATPKLLMAARCAPQEPTPPLNGSLAFHLQRIRRGVQIVGYNKPLFFAPTQRRERATPPLVVGARSISFSEILEAERLESKPKSLPHMTFTSAWI